jgi:glyoxylase-like metal-dependent hydrolase (beta-lactamase superfamily II)
MVKKFAAPAVLLMSLSLAAAAQDAKAVIADAYKAMGAEKLNSIEYSGSAWYVRYGSAPSANGPWTGSKITEYVRAIDLGRMVSNETGSMISPTGFGGPPELMSYHHAITPPQSSWGDQSEFWITPWAFLKGAAANNATLRSRSMAGMRYSVVTWKTPQKAPSGIPYTVSGLINDRNLVERVETWVDHPIFGDMHVEVTYLSYQDFDGVQVPTHVVMRHGDGATSFEAWIASATANPANIAQLVQLPPARPERERALVMKSEKLADGVYRISGGPGVYVALAVAMRDYSVVLEAGQSVELGSAILTETKKVIPNKPVRYVFNTHPHYDHSSGLAPFVAEDVTIITHQNNKDFFERALSGPRTLVGDALAKNHKKPKFETVDTMKIIGDETHSIEFYHIEGSDHSDGMLVAYLRKEKILFQGDYSLPEPAEETSTFVYTLVENVVDRLHLDFESYIGVHAQNPYVPWTRADVMKAVGGTK